MKILASLKLLALACAVTPFALTAAELKSADVTIVSRLAADETLGRTLSVSISDIANGSLGQRVAEKVRGAAAKAGCARVCIVQVDRDAVSSRQGAGSGATSDVVTMPDGSSFAMPSAGPGFKLHRVSGELVVREVVKKTPGT